MHFGVFQLSAAVVFLAAFATAVQPISNVNVNPADKIQPKYEYGYIVSDKDGNAQGHVESRDGVYALGRYYVNWPNGSGQKVTYFADDWGYHPLVTYASTSPKGSSRTQFAMGEKAMAALKDNVAVTKNVAGHGSYSLTSTRLAAIVEQPNALLVPPTIPSKVYVSLAPSENPAPAFDTKPTLTSIPPVQSFIPKKTILHAPGLKEALKLASERPEIGNATELVNYTAEVGSVGSNRVQKIIRLSSYLQPPDNSSSEYNRDADPVQEQLTEEQRQNLYSSRSEIYLTTTMSPIVVTQTERNSIRTKTNGETGLNTVENDEPFAKTPDSASQSSNSIPVNNIGRNTVEQLAPLQAGISILSSEGAKPVEESIEGEPVSYKTIVDIQEGISLDIKQNPDGSIRLASNFGERLTTEKPVLVQEKAYEKPTPLQGLAYERRLVNPAAQEIVKETDPIRREEKQIDLLARQEAEILAVQKSIEELQQQIISQIDADHAEQEKKQQKGDAQKVEEDQNSIQSSNTPVEVAPTELRENVQYVSPSPVPEQQPQVAALIAQPVEQPQTSGIIAGQIQQPLVQTLIPVVQPEIAPSIVATEEKIPVSYAQVDRESVASSQIEALPQQITVKSQNLAGILTLNPPSQHEDVTADLVPPPLETNHEQPVLVEPYPVEDTEPKLLPPPSPTLFPVKVETPVIVEKPTVVETTKVVEKPVVVKEPVEYTKVVEVEKPVPVLQPYPVEVTKVVHVDRPVPVPHPIHVSHPVPVPVAVPHAVEVPVPIPHLIPVPEYLPIALKEYYPIFIQNQKNKKQIRLQPGQLFTPEPTNAELLNPGTKLRSNVEFVAHHGDLQFSDEALGHTLTGFDYFHGDSFQRNRGHKRNKNVLKNLRIEYGFKPPLRPSVEITEEIKPSIYGPSVRSD